MGLYRRGKVWWFTIKTDQDRIQESTGTENKKLAENIYAKAKTEAVEGRWFDNAKSKSKTFDEMMKVYFEKIAGKESTRQRKEGALPHLKEVFSGLTLDRITPEAVDDYKQKRLADKAAHSTILNEVRLLSHAFNTIKWRKDNPVRDANRIKLKARKVERWLSFEEEKRLLPKTEVKLHDDLSDIVILDLNTGLSQEEILTLKWSQIDFFRKSLQTVRSKTLKARTIPLNTTALELLKRRSRVKSISGYIFTNGIDNKHDASKLKRAFKLAVAEAEIEDFTFHCLRHTFATRLAQSGVDIYTVSKLLGHEDVSTTARHYAHHYTESLRRGVDILESCYNSATVANEEAKVVVNS